MYDQEHLQSLWQADGSLLPRKATITTTSMMILCNDSEISPMRFEHLQIGTIPEPTAGCGAAASSDVIVSLGSAFVDPGWLRVGCLHLTSDHN